MRYVIFLATLLLIGASYDAIATDGRYDKATFYFVGALAWQMGYDRWRNNAKS